MNADEAKREAVKVLALRLNAYGITDGAMAKAQQFMDDMRLAGWRWDHPENRPQPPKVGEFCHTCSRHLRGCVCGEQRTVPPSVERTPPTPAYLQARAASRAAHPTHTDTESE